MLRKARYIIASVVIVMISAFGLATLSTTPTFAATGNCESDADFLGFPTWYRGLPCDASDGHKLDLQGQAPGNIIFTVVLNVVDMLLRAAGIICAAMILLAGAKYMTASGNLEKQASARKALSQSAVGMGIAVLASPIVGFVVAGITEGVAVTDSGVAPLSASVIIGNALGLIYWLLGIIAGAMIIAASYQLLTSKGFPDKALTARHTVLGAVIGLVLVLLAAFITNVIIDLLG